MNTPRSVDLAITNRCNLRCTYCSHFASAGDVEHDLPTEEWLGFLDELNCCSVLDVILQGGEPFCRSDLKQIIEEIVSNQMRFSILTNGTLITDDIAAFLASTKRCNNVQVSIDGSIPIIHDAYRGDGNFLRAMRGVRRLQRFQVPVTVRVTIHNKNVGDLEAVARLLLKDIGLSGFSTNAASYMGLCRKNSQKVQLTTEERSIAMETLWRLKQHYNGRISAAAGPLAEAEHWLKMEKARQEGLDSIPGKGYLTACGGVMSQMAIRADGVIVPCSQVSHIELGRINRDDLKKVWQTHPEMKRLRQRQSILLKDFEFCQGCEYINYCTGNCPALAYTIVGEENHPSPDACLKRFLEEGGRLPKSL